MRKIISLLFIGFLILVPISYVIAPNTENHDKIPKAAAPIDFSFSFEHAVYDFQKDALIFYVGIESESKNIANVIVNVEGTNYTMGIHEIEGGIPMHNKYSTTFLFSYFMKQPDEGDYDVTFYAENSSGSISYNYGLVSVNKTPTNYLTNQNLAVKNLHGNVFSFEYKVRTKGGDEPNAVLTINQENRSFDHVYWEKNYWYYKSIIDFGKFDNDTYYINATANLNSEYVQSVTYMIQTNPTHLTSGWLYQRDIDFLDGNIEIEYIPYVSDSFDLTPKAAIIQINDKNYSVDVTPHEFANQLATVEYYWGIDSQIHWNNVPLNPITIQIAYEIINNITFWINNGTWINASFYQYEYDFQLNSHACAITVLNESIFEDDTTRKCNISISITSNSPSFSINFWNIMLYWKFPSMGSSNLFSSEYDFFDTDYSDGKQYNFIFSISSTEVPFWGSLAYYISYTYVNDSTLYPNNNFPATGVNEIEDTEGSETRLNLKRGDYIYDVQRSIPIYAGKSFDTTEAIRIRILGIGREFGSEYIDYTIDFKCYNQKNSENWNSTNIIVNYNKWKTNKLETNPFFVPATRLYYDVEKEEEGAIILIFDFNYNEQTVIPFYVYDFTKFDEWLLESVQDDNIYTRDGNKWNFEFKSGDYQSNGYFDFTSQSMLKEMVYGYSIGEYGYSIQIELVPDYSLWILLVIIAAIALIGVGIYIKKKKARGF